MQNILQFDAMNQFVWAAEQARTAHDDALLKQEFAEQDLFDFEKDIPLCPFETQFSEHTKGVFRCEEIMRSRGTH